MSGIFLRWGIPAFLTVVGGTVAAIATSGAAIPQDLSARTAAILTPAESQWASVHYDMRDAVVTGTATDQQLVDAVVAKLAALHGVRSVTARTELAESVSPYPFAARLAQGELSLSGGLPAESDRAAILALAGEGAVDHLRLISGAPPISAWTQAIAYSLKFIQGLDQGEVKLADLELSVTGRAKSPADYNALLLLAETEAPAALTIVQRDIEPPLVSPYEWRADFDGRHLSLAGHAPNAAMANRLAALQLDGVELSSSLQLASGAPPDFEVKADTLLKNLLQLESGSASISDTTSTFSGAPATAETAASVRLAMTPIGTRLTLEPPRVGDYWLAATSGVTGIALTGYVPDEATKSRLEALDRVDAGALALARGAPERFLSGVDYMLEALARMGEGRGEIRGTALTLSGRASSVADFSAIEAMLALGVPQGLTLANVDIAPPLATPFTWAAEKSPDGQTSMAGYVPSTAVRANLRQALPALRAETTVLADGEPADFESLALKGLVILETLDTGKLSYDGASWELAGTASSPQQAFEAQSAFNASGLKAAGWSYEVALPKPPTPAILPVIDPYTWRAQKAADGKVTFTGFLPTAQLQRYLAVRLGTVTDDTSLGAGAPPDFVAAALAGVDALAQLEQGTLSFASGNWSLDGTTATSSSRIALEAALGKAVDAKSWHVAIQAADAAPVVTPYAWSAVKAADGSVTLSGYVPTEDLRALASAQVGRVARDTTLVGSGEPEDFAPELIAGLDALSHLQSGALRFADGNWSIEGQPASAAAAAALQAALTGAEQRGWRLAIAAPPVVAETPVPPVAAEIVPEPAPAEPATPLAEVPAPAPEPEPPAALEPAPVPSAEPPPVQAVAALPHAVPTTPQPALELCRSRVAAFAERNAILFQSGSATLTAESGAALDELATYLALCPQSSVDVEGHTDADGDADANLALSVARAEAVVNELIARGVGPERLYAVGYGESLPIASNETNAGKQANRRIAFTILADPE